VTPSSPNFEANCTNEIFSAPTFNTTIWDDEQSVLYAHISEAGDMDAAEPDARSGYWHTCTLF
jgi:hypothetical protein